jgi:hypothetical protein
VGSNPTRATDFSQNGGRRTAEEVTEQRLRRAWAVTCDWLR